MNDRAVEVLEELWADLNRQAIAAREAGEWRKADELELSRRGVGLAILKLEKVLG